MGDSIKKWVLGLVIVGLLLWVGASMGSAEVSNLIGSVWDLVQAIGSAILRAIEGIAS